MFRKLFNCKKGAALLEYSLLAAGVSLIASAGIAVFGHKTNDLISSVAAVLPGVHEDDNGPIASGKIIETTPATGGATIGVDVGTIVTNSDTARLGNNIGVTGLDTLIIEQ